MQREISTFDLAVDYVVGEGTEEDLLNGYRHFPCRIESGFFILCTEGSLQVTINANTYHISKNDLITLPPHYYMEIQEFSPDICIYYIGFSSGLIESINLMKSTQYLLPVIIQNPIVTLSSEDAHSYKLLYESFIYASKSSRTRTNREIIKAILSLFIQGATEIYKMRNNWELPAPTRKYEIYQEFMRLLMKNYPLHHNTSFYARELGISLPHFCSTIKAATGNTPLEVIASVLLMEAKARLKSTDEPVKKVALAVGFGNLSFFNKFFKLHTGVTPQEYRES